MQADGWRPLSNTKEKHDHASRESVMVNVPVSRAYNQWTQFEEFPKFMGGVQSVTQLSDDRLDWVAEIAGVAASGRPGSSSRCPTGRLPGQRPRVYQRRLP